jgi:hypothetical protein
MANADSSEWVTVSGKGKKLSLRPPAIKLNRRASKVSSSSTYFSDSQSVFTVEATVANIDCIISELEATSYYAFVMETLGKHVKRSAPFVVPCFIALGIGSFSNSITAQLQLSLLICCRNFLSTLLPPDTMESVVVHCFDPCMTEADKCVAQYFNIVVDENNCRGKHRATASNTIYFMPHCPYRLYCNVLWENWDILDRISIFGNR